jgi:hypothetical protein
MRKQLLHVIVIGSVASAPALAQHGPMSTALRANAIESARNLVAAAELMPADKYAFKPSPTQHSFGELIAHAGQANDYLCGLLGGVAPPKRAKGEATAAKTALIARLRESNAFCADALTHLDDATLGDELTFLGKKTTRAAVMLEAVADWESHYSQAAAYLRLNGMLPPTAKPMAKPSPR